MHVIAAVQMVSTSDVNENLAQAAQLIEEAIKQQAELVVLPENFALMPKQTTDTLAIQEAYGQGPLQKFLAEQARLHGIWLVGGTLPLVSNTPDKVYSACLTFNPAGECVARYHKLHLFDAHLEHGESYQESKTYQAGDELVTVATPLGSLGIAICYDLRFPELFRAMLAQSIELIALPSAFTEATGRAHWDILVRTRAVENLSYMIAANQGGTHDNGRQTYGNSMIVDPWGKVLDKVEKGIGIVCADLDRVRIAHLRERFPVLQHRRLACMMGE